MGWRDSDSVYQYSDYLVHSGGVVSAVDCHVVRAFDPFSPAGYGWQSTRRISAANDSVSIAAVFGTYSTFRSFPGHIDRASANVFR